MFVTGFTVKLGLVLVDAAGVEGLGAGLALDALLVEGGAVHRHAGLGREDAGLAGGTARGGRWCPAHPVRPSQRPPQHWPAFTAQLNTVWTPCGTRAAPTNFRGEPAGTSGQIYRGLQVSFTSLTKYTSSTYRAY